MTERHVNHTEYRILQARLENLHEAASRLLLLDRTELSDELRHEADALEDTTFWVHVPCLVHRGDFEATTTLRDGLPHAGICGPCNASIEAMIVANGAG